jgi:hypothetical protein
MTSQESLQEFGFKFGKNGAHSARSMMIVELQQLLAGRAPESSKEDYQADIIDYNMLQKATANARKLTFRHLVDLYGLSPDVTLFRALRHYWDMDEAAQPMLALQLAAVRDPLFRKSISTILALQPGEHLSRETTEQLLAEDDIERFSPASLKSFAQNINGTWTQAGYLTGKHKKYKNLVNPSCVNLAFALFLAHLNGLSGQRLFSSEWCKLLDTDQQSLYELAQSASIRGLINFKQASEVIEVTFPPLLTEQERELIK